MLDLASAQGLRVISQADVTTGAMIGYMKLGRYKPFPSDTYPALEALSQRLEAMEAFIACRPAPDETMPAQRASGAV